MGRLILIRHGETVKNITSILHTADDPEVLDAVGRQQITAAAQKLSILSPDIIYSSEEKRAVESAEILSRILHIPYETITGLQERSWGIYSGKPWPEVKALLDTMNIEERYNYIPSGGESWKTFATRLISAVTGLVKSHPDKTVIVVTHGGAIRALMPFLLNVPREESFKYDPANASYTIFNFNGQNFFNIKL